MDSYYKFMSLHFSEKYLIVYCKIYNILSRKTDKGYKATMPGSRNPEESNIKIIFKHIRDWKKQITPTHLTKTPEI